MFAQGHPLDARRCVNNILENNVWTVPLIGFLISLHSVRIYELVRMGNCSAMCPLVSKLFVLEKKPSPAEFETRSDATAIPACQTSTCHCKCPAGTRTTLLHDFQNNPVGILVSMRFFSRIVSHLPLHSNPKGRMSWKRLLCQLGNIACPSSRSQWKIFCQNSLNWDGLVGFHNAFSVSKLPCCNF